MKKTKESTSGVIILAALMIFLACNFYRSSIKLNKEEVLAIKDTIFNKWRRIF